MRTESDIALQRCSYLSLVLGLLLLIAVTVGREHDSTRRWGKRVVSAASTLRIPLMAYKIDRDPGLASRMFGLSDTAACAGVAAWCKGDGHVVRLGFRTKRMRGSLLFER